MDRLRVIAPLGATIRGEVQLALTPDQARRRASVLVATKKAGIYRLPEGTETMLKYGEEFGAEFDGRLNRALFEDLGAEKKAAKAAKAAKAGAGAKPEDAREGEGGARDGTGDADGDTVGDEGDTGGNDGDSGDDE